MNMEKLLFNNDYNLKFLEFNNFELNLLFNELKDFYLVYRESLDLPSTITFGTELEYDLMYKGLCDNFLAANNLINWISKRDKSLIFGGEICSPILIDCEKSWRELKNICDFLTEKHANMRLNSGGHIHIGAKILDNNIDAWKSFLKLYMCYEHILFRFGYGDKVNGRRNMDIFSKRCAEKLFDNLKFIEQSNTLEDLHYSLEDKQGNMYALNFNHIRFNENYNHRFHTIEFRFPNASNNEIIWQNNINVFSKMILSCLNGKIDNDLLNNKLKENFSEHNELKYNLMILEDALEFADLVFDNNLDKMYFLRQYFKNFEYYVGKCHGVIAKNFTLKK